MAINSIFDFPVHLQGEAWLYAREHDGQLPSLPALLRHYGRSANVVGRADVEKHDTTLLSKLYATVIVDGDQDELDASYAVHCRLAKLVGESVVRDLANGYNVSQTAERNGLNRKTLQRAFALVRQNI